MTGYVDLLRRERDFRRVYFSELVSLGGDWFALIPLLTLLPEITGGGGLWGGLVLAADTATFALLSPYAGTLVDRLDRRHIMVVADLVSAVLVLLLLLVRSEGTAWIALVAMGGVAAAKAFYSPAASAAIPNLVDPPDLSRASVLGGASWGTTLAVGAALGGIAAQVIGTDACFVVDAGSFLLSAYFTGRTTRPFGEDHSATPRASVREDLRETVRYARSAPRVLALLGCKIGPGLGNGAIALYPLFATSVFHAPKLGTGLLFSARGVGALVGPLLLRRVVVRDERRMLPVLGGSMAAFGLAYVAFGLTPLFPVALGIVVLAHMGGGANWILSTYGLQATVPDWVRGRVFAADYMVATLAIAMSQVGTGLLSEHADPRPIAVGLGTVVLAYAVGWFVLTRRLEGTRGGS